MKTRRIWVWSFIFGLSTALVAYIVLFSNENGVPSNSTRVQAETGVDNKEHGTPETDKELTKEKKVNNPLIPVSEGKRAMSLRVAALDQGVSGYIEPNSHIDIIAYQSTIDEATKKELRTAKLMLQNIKVLSSGKATDLTEEAILYETITVEVTPEEGVMLSLASKDQDGFYFMLRSSEDKSVKTNAIQETREVLKGGTE
jgi:pilus assembly protein CpaB